MPPSNRLELTQYLPPDLVAEATKRLKETLLVAAKNPELSLLELFATFATQELNFRENVTPVGEAEVTKLDQLARDLRGQIGEATQDFGVLATQVDNQGLLAARDKFREETSALQQRLDGAEKVGGKTRDVVNALIKDAKSGRVILGSVAGLEKKGADLPAIVSAALLRSLFQQEGTPIERSAATDAQDFVAAGRRAVVASSSRRAELPSPAEIETVVRVTRPPRAATAPKPSGRFGVKDVLETAGIDTSGLALIDPAHIAKALPGATRKLFNVEPTAEAMAETLLAIARQEADPDQFGEAASLRKLYGLGSQISGTPPAIISEAMTPKGITPLNKPDELEQVRSRQFLVRQKTPLAAVFNFKGDSRWDAGNWGLIAHHTKGTPRTRGEAGKQRRMWLKAEMEQELPEQINKLLACCKDLGVETLAQLAQTDRIQIPDEMKDFLVDLTTQASSKQPVDLPVDVLVQLPGIINIPDGTPTKPTRRGELLTMMRKQKKPQIGQNLTHNLK